jgi:hypothetical protein
MKAKKFGFFFTVKYIDKNIEAYREVLKATDKLGAKMYNSKLIEDYPKSVSKLKNDGKSLVDGTQRLLRSVDFVISFFSDKSRIVFLQTIMALENKTPALCLVHEDEYNNFPETLLSYGKDYVKYPFW